jgi:hypothetical protein
MTLSCTAAATIYFLFSLVENMLQLYDTRGNHMLDTINIHKYKLFYKCAFALTIFRKYDISTFAFL